jgi:sporulation protein YlmC with PRC-barrel domain
MRNTLLVSTASAALLLVAAPLAGHAQTQPPASQPQQSGQAQQPPGARQAQPNASLPFTRVQIRTAGDLTGKPLLDAAGGVVGEIDYLLIDSGSARVRFAVVGRGGVLDLGEQLIAVPWEHVRFNAGRPPRIDAFMEDLEGAPRLDWSTIHELIEPNFVTRVTNYFAPIVAQGRQGGAGQTGFGESPSGPQAGSRAPGQASNTAPESRGQPLAQAGPSLSGQQSSQSVQERQGTGQTRFDSAQTGAQAGNQARGSGGTMTPDGMQTMLSDRSIGAPGQQRAQTQPTQQSAGQPSPSGPGRQLGQVQPQMGGASAQQQGQAAAQSSPQQGQRGQQQAQPLPDQQGSTGFILVGRSVVTTLGPPAFNLATGLRGAEVVAQDGSEIGEISEIMIDVDRGRVAYVTIAQGGFLGLGEALKPAPLQSLEWVAPETFRLKVPKGAPDRMPKRTGDVPTMVRRSDLEKLYQHYGLTPYWQQT